MGDGMGWDGMGWMGSSDEIDDGCDGMRRREVVWGRGERGVEML